MNGRIRITWAAALIAVMAPLAVAGPAMQPVEKPAEQAVPAAQPAEAAPQAPAPPPAKAEKKKKKADAAPAPEATEPAGAPAEAAPPSPPAPPAKLSFDIDEAVVWLDGTQVLPFRVDQPFDQDRTFPAAVRAEGKANPGLEVVREPQVLAGETLGFLRVRAAEPGRARLTLGPKGAAATLYIDARPSPAAVAELRQTPPTIVSPADGAVVWGTIGVSIEVFSPAGDPGEVGLVTPDGERLYPVERTDPDAGPLHRFGFTVDTDGYGAGPITFTAVADTPGGVQGKPVEGGSITLYLHRPADGDLTTGEAEDRADAPRPQRYASTKTPEDPQPPLKISDGEDASGGRFVNNAGKDPALVLRLTPAEGGWYQVIMTARGDDSLGVLPAIGLHLNNNDKDPRTASAIALTSVASHPDRPADLPQGRGPGRGRPVRERLVRGQGRGPQPVPRPLRGGAAARRGGQGRGGRTGASRWRSTRRSTAARSPASSPHRVRRSCPGKGRRPAAGNAAHQRRAAAEPEHPRPAVHPRPVGPQARREHPATASPPTVRDARPPRPRTRRHAAGPPRPDGRGPAGLPLLSPPMKLGTPARPERITLKQAEGDPALAFYSNGAATLDLTAAEPGTYRLQLDALGEKFKDDPIAAITLVVGDQRTPLGEVKVGTDGFRDRSVGEVTLPAGPKALEVAFINDAADAGSKKDRNLFVRSLRLTGLAEADTLGPAAVVRYPDDAHAAYRADAVVADVSDDRKVAWAQVMLDGEPTGGRVDASDGRGRVLLPLVLRGVSPGEHRLSVQVADAAGHVATTAERKLNVLADAPETPGKYEAAVRLLDRFAYGPEPRQLAAVLLDGPRDYLRRQLDRDADDPGVADAWRQASARHTNATRRATAYLNETPNPVRARLVMFIDNHFNTWPTKTGGERKAPEFDRWVRLGPAPFIDLLNASASSPAMLNYLDQYRSSRNKINENYAREVMELHTLGVHGGYSQNDVTELAHLLAGWGYTSAPQPAGGPGKLGEVFAYAASRNDPAPRTVFGLRFDETKPRAERFDRVRLALEMLAAHPATARFISGKLAAHYLTLDPDAAERFADDLAKVFQQSGGDLREVVAAIAASEVYAVDSRRPRLSHPLTFATRLLRLAGSRGDYLIHEFTRRSGFGVFDRETPDGYPEEDEAYADSNAMLQRWRLAAELDANYFQLLPDSLRNLPADVKDHPEAAAAWQQRVVDELAIRLTGRLLSERSNAAVLDVLSDSDLEAWRQVRLAGTTIAQMPEVSLR